MWIRLLSEHAGRPVGSIFEVEDARGKDLIKSDIAEKEPAPKKVDPPKDDAVPVADPA